MKFKGYEAQYNSLFASSMSYKHALMHTCTDRIQTLPTPTNYDILNSNSTLIMTPQYSKPLKTNRKPSKSLKQY